MSTTKWSIATSHGRHAWHTFSLTANPAPRGLEARFTITKLGSGRHEVVVTFSSQCEAVARLEAHALAVTCYSAIVDGDHVQVEDVLVQGSTCTVVGLDAFLAVVPHFGGDFGTDNACDAMVDELAQWLASEGT